MKEKIKKIGGIIANAVYPPACAVCGKPLGDDTGPPGLSGIHMRCFSHTIPLKGNLCGICGKSIGDDDIYCKDCNETQHTFDRSFAVYEINSDMKDSIYRFKYQSKREYAEFYAKSIYEAHKNLLHFLQPELLIPIPMYQRKERVRGYNQAALIAGELGSLLDVPVNTDALVRTKKTVPLKDCSFTERRKIMDGAFEVQETIYVKRVLVVDDIYTTGSTLDACASVLKQAGVEKVYGVNVCIGAGV